MKKVWHKLVAKVTGKNSVSAPKELIIDQMNEPRALPMGRKEFDEWSDRIISGALIPGGEDDKEWFNKTLKMVIADTVTHLGPTESHKPDAHFIHRLRKITNNQVCLAYVAEVKAEQKVRLEAEAAKKEPANVPN